jgi:putative ABC transport system permease protein
MATKGTTILLAEVRESFFMAMGALAAHKLRSALTLLGVLVGVFSIIVVMTAMRVMQNDIESHISQLGSQTFMIRKWPGIYFGGPEGFEKYWRRKNITLQQGLRLEDKATLAHAVGIETVFWGGQVESKYKKSPPTVQMFGETPGSFPARNWIVTEGRILQESDVENNHDVCILGNALCTNVFPFGSPVGERLKINGINYTVVGILEPKGGAMGGNQDNFAIVPITTGMNRFGRWNRSLNILVQARDSASYDDCVEQVRGAMRVIRKVPPGKEDDFEIFSNDSLIQQFKSFTMAVRVGVSLVSSIALLAAGIGIMNIMLVSVTERTREIGLRMAIGARRRDIRRQFLMEALTLALAGGLAGAAFGSVAAITIAWKAGWPVLISPWTILLACGVAACVGVFFGLYPAYRASRLDPIEALRFE